MHKHSKTHNKMVRHILKRIAHQSHVLYPEMKQKFVIDCDMTVTLQFCDLLKEEYPIHHFTEVSCCPGCGKFDLE
jgi:hypothetical protein